MAKLRLDQLLVDRELVPSRNKAQALIQLGQVLVNEVVVEKSGTQVRPDVTIRIRGNKGQFVSRGGDKLEAAMTHFNIDCSDWIAADPAEALQGARFCDAPSARHAPRDEFFRDALRCGQRALLRHAVVARAR